jgi:hypothetical protein
MKVFFSEFFDITESDLKEHGAFDISLINDLPLFIDPFLLFGSKNPNYQKLHTDILNYLSFLKGKAVRSLSSGHLKAWYYFPEVKQTWLGYSLSGNEGRGLANKFGQSLSTSINYVFADLGNERITTSSHLEKACLFHTGVGRDNISDFACNLIKAYLLEYTEKFALKYLEPNQIKSIKVDKVYFDYTLNKWMPKHYTLPYIFNDYVILTPIDILTKDEVWISKNDLYGNFEDVCNSVPNDQLRAEVNEYFYHNIPAPEPGKRPSQKAKNEAVAKTLEQYPQLIDYFIKDKEENKEGAKRLSEEKIEEIKALFQVGVQELINALTQTKFYTLPAADSYESSYQRVLYMKQVIENNDGYRIFYTKGKPLKRESDLQVIYKLTWFASDYDVNREVNNGRGPVDYAVSKGQHDKTLIEFKLASNSSLKKNLENQVKVYEKASQTRKSIKVILYFDSIEFAKVNAILKDLKLDMDKSIVLIDAGKDNKPSASKAQSSDTL